MMKVSEMPIQLLADTISRHHQNLQNRLSDGSLVRLRKQIYDAFRVRMDDANRIAFLIKQTEDLKKEFQSIGIDWSLEPEEQMQKNVTLIRTALEQLDLSQLEFLRQADLAAIQRIIDRCSFIVLELEALNTNLIGLDRVEANTLVLKFLSKDEPNIRFWDTLSNGGFSTSFNEHVQHEFILYEVIPTFRELYKTLCSNLIRLIEDEESTTILNLYVEGEPEPEGHEDWPTHFPLHDVLGRQIKTLIENVESKLSNLEEVKSDIDDGFEDVNFDSLLRKVKQSVPELSQPVYELIWQRDYLYEQLDNLGSFHNSTAVQSKKTVENLALMRGNQPEVQDALRRCHKAFSDVFIEDCPPEVFVSLFVNRKFAGQVNWIAGLYTLNYFVNGISGALTHSDLWVRANNCFLNNGKQIGKGSLRKGNTHKVPQDELIETLDASIKDILDSGS